MKYANYDIVMQEVPGEVSLALNLSNCPCHCKGCHSAYLAEDIGIELTEDELLKLIDNNLGITCVAFMGGDSDPNELLNLATAVKSNRPNLKLAWYSGRSQVESGLIDVMDYIKIGPYDSSAGPLSSKTTNQKFYKVTSDKSLEDITYKFWKI